MKFSIVTINYNNIEGLKRTVESVISQNFDSYEYIVIDGGSTDGGKEYLETVSDKITYWVSEKDGGIYDAMNKGAQKAIGDYLLFLNSGDYFIDNNVLNAVSKFQPKEDIVYCDTYFSINDSRIEQVYPDALTLYFFTHSTINHQSTFIHKSLFDKYGYYDSNMKICADKKFFMSVICKYNCTYRHLPITITDCNLHGASSDGKNGATIIKEKEDILREEFPAYEADYKRMQELETLVEQFYASKGIALLKFLGMPHKTMLEKLIKTKVNRTRY
ncbi:MAG: glycosyltransferase [Bacteroidetes bacterium]|nr:glycosyltransferase [Bacteroidota bacterium]